MKSPNEADFIRQQIKGFEAAIELYEQDMSSQSIQSTDIPRIVSNTSIKIIKITAIHGFNGSGIPDLAMENAISELQTPYLKIILTTFSYENNPHSLLIQASLTSHHKHQNIQRGDISSWPTDAHAYPFPDTDLFFLTSGSPCDRISKGTVLNGKGTEKAIGTHAFPSNLLHVWHQGMISLAKQHNTPIASLFEMTPPFDQNIRDELQLIFGTRMFIECHLWGGAFRDRDFYLNPSIRPMSPQNTNSTYKLPKGKIWPPPDIRPFQKNPPTITTYYPKNLLNKRTEKLSPTELANLKEMRVIDLPNSRISYAGVPEVAHWLGLSAEDINRLSDVFPCEKYVHKLSTMSIQQYKVIKEEVIPTDIEYCGQSKLCIPCMDTITVLGRSWHLKATQQIIKTND